MPQLQQCANCPHEEHMFSTCFHWPDCDCSQRLDAFCDNMLSK